MRWTKLNELGTGGRMLASVLIGIVMTAVFMVCALMGVTVFRSPMLSIVLSAPLLPGLALAALLGMMNGGVEELSSALYFNAGLYSLLTFGIWQRQASKRTREDNELDRTKP